MILFSTKKYQYLKEEFLKDSFYTNGEIEEKIFSDGEKYTRVISDFKNKNVSILGGTLNDEDIMDIYDLGCGLVKLGVKSLTIIVPFFGYSTMERAEKEGEIVKAKTRARLLSQIPTAYQGNNIILVDLHKDGIVHYFENSIHSTNICTNELIVSKIKELNLTDFALGSTDEGGLKRIRKISNELGVNPLVVLKRRTDKGVELECASSIESDLKYVVIIDDMIRSGKSIIQSMNAYSASNEKIKFVVIATHGVFCDEAYKLLIEDKRITKIIVSNSHPGSSNKNIDIMDITKQITEKIKEVCSND